MIAAAALLTVALLGAEATPVKLTDAPTLSPPAPGNSIRCWPPIPTDVPPGGKGGNVPLNFDAHVYDSGRHAFIKFFAPWCAPALPSSFWVVDGGDGMAGLKSEAEAGSSASALSVEFTRLFFINVSFAKENANGIPLDSPSLWSTHPSV